MGVGDWVLGFGLGMGSWGLGKLGVESWSLGRERGVRGLDVVLCEKFAWWAWGLVREYECLVLTRVAGVDYEVLRDWFPNCYDEDKLWYEERVVAVAENGVVAGFLGCLKEENERKA